MSSCSRHCPSSRETVRRARPLLGTFVEIAVETGAAEPARGAMDRAFAAMETVQARMSPYLETSDVARINQAATGSWTQVHADTWKVLMTAQTLSEISGGVFDITRSGGARGGNWRSLELGERRRVRRNAPVKIDLGGIAKGFAVDQAVRVLTRSAIPAALVNAGGDLRAAGDKPWPVSIRHPAALHEFVDAGTLVNGAFATSANYFDSAGAERLRRPDGEPLWLGEGSVSVQAPTCMMADALTKIVAAVGPRTAEPILRRYNATAVTMATDGRVERTVQIREASHAA